MQALSDLDSFSADFAEDLFRLYPQWRELARSEHDDEFNRSYLVVEVAKPAGSDLDHSLVVTTFNEEVTVQLDYYHEHFDWPTEEGLSEQDPMLFIAALLSEDLAVASYWAEGRWKGSAVLAREEQVKAKEGCTVRIRSWRGNRDEDITWGKKDG